MRCRIAGFVARTLCQRRRPSTWPVDLDRTAPRTSPPAWIPEYTSAPHRDDGAAPHQPPRPPPRIHGSGLGIEVVQPLSRFSSSPSRAHMQPGPDAEC